MKKTGILILIFGSIILYACKHEILNPNNPAAPANPANPSTPSDEVCFADVLDIFRSSCAKSGCHDVTTRTEGYVFDSYTNIMKAIKPKDPNGSKAYKMITETDARKRMPKAPYPALLPAQISLIEKWINQGAKNTLNCSNACDTTQFTYTAVKKIIDANCINCHSGATPSGGLNYSTYAGLKAVADNGKLLGAVSHNTGYTPMPFQQPKLIDCKITQIKKWIQSGAPNN